MTLSFWENRDYFSIQDLLLRPTITRESIFLFPLGVRLVTDLPLDTETLDIS